MTVGIEKLLKMAEQISANLAYTDDHTVTAASVADHLNKFWDPRMRAALRDYAADHNAALSKTLQLAVNQLN